MCLLVRGLCVVKLIPLAMHARARALLINMG